MPVGCIFCDLSRDQVVKIWENDQFFAILNNYPVSPGHSLVIPKRHVVNLSDLKSSEKGQLLEVVSEIVNLIKGFDLVSIYQEKLNKASGNSAWFIKKALENPDVQRPPDGFNHGINDGKAAGRTVDHLHWHIIPRYFGDVEDPVGGVLHVIPGMGNYKLKRE